MCFNTSENKLYWDDRFTLSGGRLWTRCTYQTVGQTDRRTDTQTDGRTGRQTDGHSTARQTDRQMGKPKNT